MCAGEGPTCVGGGEGAEWGAERVGGLSTARGRHSSPGDELGQKRQRQRDEADGDGHAPLGGCLGGGREDLWDEHDDDELRGAGGKEGNY